MAKVCKHAAGCAVAIGAALAGADAAAGALAPEQPNVLLVIMDDVGVDKIGAYAQDVDPAYADAADFLPDTPVLDSIAAHGVRFTQAWSNPTCSPTRATLLTGTHAFRTGVGGPIGVPGSAELSTDATTLAQVMREAGYATGLFGKWHLGDNPPPADWGSGDTWEDHEGERYDHELHPNSLGFQRFVGTEVGSLEKAGAGNSYSSWVALIGDSCEDCEQPSSASAVTQDRYATTATVLDALSWIHKQDTPWLAVVSFHAAHVPLELPPLSCSYRETGAEDPELDIGIYEEIVECMDRRIGNLLDGIDDLQDTLVIVVSDNGTDADWTEDIFATSSGKGSITEGGIRVPLMVADGKWLAHERPDWEWSLGWAKAPTTVAERGQELHALVHVQDIFATIGGVGLADTSSGLDSYDLRPLLAGTRTQVRDVVYTEQFRAKGTGQAALRSGDWKLVVRLSSQYGSPCRDSFELYDLASDRFELVDVAEEELPIVEALLESFDEITAGAWADQPEC